MSLFHGLSAFPITPTDADGIVDSNALARCVARLAVPGVASIGLLGSTGGYAYLHRDQRRKAIEVAVEVLGGKHTASAAEKNAKVGSNGALDTGTHRPPLIVGVGALRTDEAQALTRDAEAAGADGLLLAPVSYTPLTDDEVFEHFSAVAGSTGLPICIYHNPSTTHFRFSDALIVRLAQVSNVVAVKQPGLPAAEIGPVFRSLQTQLPADFAIGYSGDWHASGALLAGAHAWFSVFGGILPVPAARLAAAAMAQDRAGVQACEQSLAPLWALFQQYGSFRVVYAIAQLLRLTDAVPPRPVMGVPRERWSEIEAAMHLAMEGAA
jgi:4-hydroxy-tetrahydrodipicolinate synthase